MNRAKRPSLWMRIVRFKRFHYCFMGLMPKGCELIKDDLNPRKSVAKANGISGQQLI